MESILRDLSSYGITEWAEETWKSHLSDVELPNEIKSNRKHIIKQIEKMSKILSREVVEANIFNDNIMTILAAFILQLSPFLDNTPMDDQRIVDEVTMSIEAYFRVLSTERALAYNIYHPTLYESSLQILENIISHYSIPSSTSKRSQQNLGVTTSVRRVFSGPVASMGDLFTNFSIPDQYLQSTVNTVITFFTIACKAEITSGLDGIERAIHGLATSRDATVHITMIESLVEITSGYSLSKTTHLKKDETTLWERATDLLVKSCSDEKRTVSIFTGLADRAPSRKMCSDLVFKVGQSILCKFNSEAGANIQIAIARKVIWGMKHKNVKIRSNSLIHAKMILSTNQEFVKIDNEISKSVLFGLIARARDISSGVVSKALHYMAELFEGGMIQPGESMLAPGRFQPTFLGRMSAGSQMSTNSAAFRRTLCCTLIEDPENQTIINQEFKAGTTECVLTQLARSKNVHVRKSLLVFIKSLVVNNLIDVSEPYVLQIIRNGCYDSLQSVRSVAISVLSRLVQHFQPGDVTNLSATMVEADKCAIIHEWFEIILPMTTDGEKTVQDKAMSEIHVQFISKLIEFANHHMYDAMESIDLDKLDDFHLFIGHVFNQTKKDQTLSNIQLRKLVKNIEDRLQYNAVYWLLLNVLYQIYPEMIDSEKILDLWRQNIDQFMQTDGNDLSLWSTKLIYLMSKKLPDEQSDIFSHCISVFMKYSQRSSPHVVRIFCKIARDYAGTGNEVKNWILENFSVKKLIKLLDKVRDKPDDLQLKLRESEVRILIMTEFYDIYPKDDLPSVSDSLVGLITENVDSKFLEMALVGLGRICAVNSLEGERIVPLFGQILSQGRTGAIQNAALLAISDLCVTKTQLVDKFLDVLASTLDGNLKPLVQNSLLLLTSLLKKDFVKMRSSILSRMLILAADDKQDGEIRELATYCLRGVISPRVPGLFYDHFTQIMILCTGAHQIENPGADSILSTQTQASVVEEGGIFQGENHRANRQKIYDFCIQNMSDKQRIKTLSKLKNEVLEAPQRNSGLSTAIPAVAEIMRDTISLIKDHPILQFPLLKGRESEDVEEGFEEDEVDSVDKKRSAYFNLVRKEYIKKHLFSELFDLRENMKIHRSSCQSALVRLMLNLLDELPEIKDLDPKFLPLKEELEAELRIWNEAEVAEPTQASQMTNRRKSNARRSMQVLNQSLRNVSINRSNCVSPSERMRNQNENQSLNEQNENQERENLTEDGTKENDKSIANIPSSSSYKGISTPFNKNTARVSLASSVSTIPTNDDDQRQNQTVATEDSLIINIPKSKKRKTKQ